MESYPNYDLLGLALPGPKTKIRTFADKLGDFSGDTLFLFVVRELSDCDNDPEECLKRLDSAIEDLEQTRNTLARKLRTTGQN